MYPNLQGSYGLKILIVEDDRPVRMMFEHQIQFLGHETKAFSRAETAWEEFQREHYPIVLLDLMLPGMNGFELCEKIKSHPAGEKTMILITTALRDISNLQKALEVGADDYLTKPIDMVALKIRLTIIENHWRQKIKRLEVEEKLIESQRQLQEAYIKVEKLARKDPLTNLSNRRDFLEKAEYERIRSNRSGRPFSVVLSDIDDFKHFNDTYGHDCGDFVLVTVANIMHNTLRKQDIVGRWGGEEIVLLLPETALEGAKLAAEKVRQRIAENPYSFNGQKFSITMTFGVSEYHKGMTIDQCIKEADKALYIGKRTGKNCVIAAAKSKE